MTAAAPLELKPSSRERVAGLDSVRFVLAAWVVLGHFALPAIPTLQSDAGYLSLLRLVYNNLFNGPAAVIAFFVISGFCIHYGVADSKRLFLPAYLTRRWLRTLLPMAAAIVISDWVGIKLGLFSLTILWSLLCEEIYYVAYPVLLAVKSRFPWSWILAGSIVGALLVVLSAPKELEYPLFGPSLNWILGFPCWILGCTLAERVKANRLPVVTRRQLWLWRAAVWAASIILSILRFHAHIGYPWTLDIFAFLVTPWLAREVSAARASGASHRMEAAGQWSYSLYLMHLSLGALAVTWLTSTRPELQVWLLRMAAAFVGSFLFYRLFERPAHHFARWASRRIADLRISEALRTTLTVSIGQQTDIAVG